MPTTPPPLSKQQRQKATAAARIQRRIRQQEGALAELRALRDRLIGELVADRVRPFVVAQETGCPGRLPEIIARQQHVAAKAVHPATKKRSAK